MARNENDEDDDQGHDDEERGEKLEADMTTTEMHRDEAEIMDAHDPVWLSAIMALGGLFGIVLGANWLISGSVELATMIGLSETVIGITIIAIGTSLPELVTCVIASIRKKADVALGNVLGSNTFIFDIFH